MIEAECGGEYEDSVYIEDSATEGHHASLDAFNPGPCPVMSFLVESIEIKKTCRVGIF